MEHKIQVKQSKYGKESIIITMKQKVILTQLYALSVVEKNTTQCRQTKNLNLNLYKEYIKRKNTQIKSQEEIDQQTYNIVCVYMLPVGDIQM